MNRRKFLAALSGSLVAFPALTKAAIDPNAGNPCKEVISSLSHPPFRHAPLLVIPQEHVWNLRGLRKAFGREFFVVSENAAITGYRASDLYILWEGYMSEERFDKIATKFKTRLLPGGKVLSYLRNLDYPIV